MTYQSLLQLARAWFGMPPSEVDLSGGLFPSNITFPDRPLYDTFTRIYNFTGALVGLILLSPLLISLALAVKFTSKGPALYRGQRVGKLEQRFDIFKFRTMKTGSEQKIGKRLARQDEDVYTPIGKFLRKYRLDELAQLLNVLRGDMNLVGPRPMRPIFLDELKRTVPGYARRFSVRPGITGKAQVRGGYYTSPRHKLFYECLYIARRSVLMDLGLIALTFLRVMTRIFTTAVLLGWLLLMAMVAPPALQDLFIIKVSSVQLNTLYLAPSLIALAHIIRREATDGRLYALRTPVDLPLAGFLIYSAALIPFSLSPLSATRGLLWYVCNGAVIFYLVLNSRMVRDRRSALVNTLIGMVSLVCVLALYRSASSLVAGNQLSRATGYENQNPLLFASILVLMLPLSLARFRAARAHSRRWIFGGTAVLFLVGTMLTLSRSGVLAVTLACCVYFWHQRRSLVVVLVLATAAILALGSTGDHRLQPSQAIKDLQAVSTRQAVLLQSVTTSRLIVGVGARTLPYHVSLGRKNERLARRAPAMENTYLTILVDQGVLGLIFFLAFLLGGLRFMFHSLKRIDDPLARDDLRATASGITGCLVLFVFSDAMYSFPVMLVFWAAFGLGMGIALWHRSGPRHVYRLVHYRHKL